VDINEEHQFQGIMYYIHLYSACILQYFNKLTKFFHVISFLKSMTWLIQVSEVFMKIEEYY
jgi:hypothetical protein